ncbi:2'-5' RNA ligase family protein [Bradyrhizobium roseum]|uniref:2'-5' RNA ligase family protein n=1 Tax=Bradyrhizobium roseum TaxID=3056648 RepID=UPI00260C5562|nr:2'-5' RNA ligase family protein [Bradyrhizobium roseus]WKA30413.1 2'-5' RNA ligase family protein [Bradyrhizobium roseus]
METTYILTAELDPESFTWLDTLRQQHFPPERNLLPAHLTMFHQLSPAQTARLDDCELPDGPVPILLSTPILLGSGVSIRIQSPELGRLRTAARQAMSGEFSKQDSQGWRPHVTIQNRVPAEAAKELYRTIENGFEESAGAVTGLLLWEYLGGPWRMARRLPFA